jgi:hypothetical protein
MWDKAFYLAMRASRWSVYVARRAVLESNDMAVHLPPESFMCHGYAHESWPCMALARQDKKWSGKMNMKCLMSAIRS